MKITYKITPKDIQGQGHLYFNFPMFQTIQNIGVFTDHDDYVFPEAPVINQISLMDKFGRLDNVTVASYNSPQNQLTFNSNSRLEDLRPYGNNNQFTTSVVINKKNVVDFNGQPKEFWDKVVSITNNDSITEYNYYIDATANNNVIQNVDYGFNATDYVVDGITRQSYFTFITQGNNFTNSSVLPIIKDEYLIGVTDVLETKSDLFIDRGNISAYEAMLKLGDVNNIEQLSNYGNGFFNIIQD